MTEFANNRHCVNKSAQWHKWNMMEEFLSYAAKRAQESVGTDYEWSFEANRDNIANFAKWMLDRDWDDVIDEFEDLPFDD
ncbi:hypothetical protein [uncultured Muribaculum sp.]|uniref:hypothetical protein n=2 Tax=uncultured Muribaculum sp. TaxID=1918613 RepID=UPI0025A675AC|nr:hypothetical protein [uncultured Muribaculum sp.]